MAWILGLQFRREEHLWLLIVYCKETSTSVLISSEKSSASNNLHNTTLIKIKLSIPIKKLANNKKKKASSYLKSYAANPVIETPKSEWPK